MNRANETIISGGFSLEVGQQVLEPPLHTSAFSYLLSPLPQPFKLSTGPLQAIIQ